MVADRSSRHLLPALVAVEVDRSGRVPVFRQIARQLRERIASHALLAGTYNERMSVLAVTRETARSFGLLATIMKTAGRSPRPRYNDLWIASNANDFRALDLSIDG